MVTSVRIAWDEENNPRPFYFCWGITTVLSVFLLLTKHVVNPSTWLKALTFFAILLPSSFYFNLVMNGVWRKNPKYSGYSNIESDDFEDAGTPISLFESSNGEKCQEVSAVLFGQSSLDVAEPILMRDSIQWGRILLATAAMAVLIVLFAFSL